jgi:hypothetical protein
MINGVFSMKNRIKPEFVLLVCMIATATLLKFVPFPCKFPKETAINNDLNFNWHLENAMISTLDGDAVRSSGE